MQKAQIIVDVDADELRVFTTLPHHVISKIELIISNHDKLRSMRKRGDVNNLHYAKLTRSIDNSYKIKRNRRCKQLFTE